MINKETQVDLILGLRDRLSKEGRWGFVLSLLFIFSISSDYRLPLFGLLMHPFLVLLPLAILFSGIQLNKVPVRVLFPLAAFFVIFTIACFQDRNPLFEIIKVASSLMVFLFFASAINTERDFRWISWGFLIVAVVIGVMGFYKGSQADLGSRLSGINVLEGLGNKNAQSLYTLPGLFFGTNLLFQYLRTRKWTPIIIVASSIFFVVVDIFLSANRSGWLGLGIIFLSFMIASGFKMRTVFVGGLLFLFAYLAINSYANDIYKRKRKQTIEGFASDEGRKILILESLKVGFENPILGAGYDHLHEEMARRLGLTSRGTTKMDTHFLIGYIFGASGIFSLLAFLFFLFGMAYQVSLRRNIYPVVRDRVRNIRILLLSFILLYLSRSFFTREILYSPTFMGGLGLIYGYYLLQVKYTYSIRAVKH